MGPLQHLGKFFFDKKILGVLGIPPKWKKGENFEIYKSIENIFMVILSPHWGVLGEKWRYSVTSKSKYAKIEIGLNPPLRELKFVDNIFRAEFELAHFEFAHPPNFYYFQPILRIFCQISSFSAHFSKFYLNLCGTIFSAAVVREK